VLGLGVWQIPDGKPVQEAVHWALESGIRHIDTARFYRNERGVGDAIRTSGVPREEIWVTTKLFPFEASGQRGRSRGALDDWVSTTSICTSCTSRLQGCSSRPGRRWSQSPSKGWRDRSASATTRSMTSTRRSRPQTSLRSESDPYVAVPLLKGPRRIL